LQVDALIEAGCEKWFLNKITCTKAERKGLDEALAYLRPGGKLTFHLMGVLAEFERDLIRLAAKKLSV
jgi:DNA invertase Pin-like site-specific DNA recombinase